MFNMHLCRDVTGRTHMLIARRSKTSKKFMSVFLWVNIPWLPIIITLKVSKRSVFVLNLCCNVGNLKLAILNYLYGTEVFSFCDYYLVLNVKVLHNDTMWRSEGGEACTGVTRLVVTPDRVLWWHRNIHTGCVTHAS